jgi:putative DNA primase/helicase
VWDTGTDDRAFGKARGVFGNDTSAFEARLMTKGKQSVWVTKPLEDVNRAKVIAMTRQGLTVADIAAETGLSKSKVGRIRKAALDSGELDEDDDA